MNRSSYASRGAIKLENFIKTSGFNPKGKICLDSGSSHGGFTQVLLLKGAKKVYAVDVGKGLLDWRLRKMDSVEVMEGRNLKNLKKKDFKPCPDAALIDVSFISLKTILPVVFDIALSEVAALAKPQFEATYEEASRGKGVISSRKIHRRIIKEIIEETKDKRWQHIGTYSSGIKGKKGNEEYFIYYERV
ncbi:MAG: TlyA family RNA methyltransferase [Elusimicrobiota bacterium]